MRLREVQLFAHSLSELGLEHKYYDRTSAGLRDVICWARVCSQRWPLGEVDKPRPWGVKG